MDKSDSLEHIGPAIESPYIPPPGRGIVRKFWEFWESLKLTVALLTIIIIASTIGTLIPQNGDFGWYVDHYGPAMAEFFRIINFYDIYKANWFTFILTMLCISTTVCTMHRYRMLKRSLSKPTVVMGDEFFTQSEHRDEITLPVKSTEALNQLQTILKKKRYKTLREDSNGSIYLFGQKGVINRWGNLLSHVAVVIIFIGGLIGKTVWPWSFDETVPIVEGQTVQIPHSQIEIRLNKFEEKYYAGSQDPSDFRSDVTVFENGKEIKDAAIRVNYPLNYAGVLFYQNSRAKSGNINGFSLAVNDPSTFDPITTWNGKVGESFIIPGTHKEIKASRFIPDFSIDENMQPVSRSDEPRNPAIEIFEYVNGQQTGHGWVFQNIRLRDLPMKQSISYDYAIAGLDAAWISIFQVVKDPGLPVVYVGFAIIIFGLITTLWLEYKRIWMKLTPQQNGILVQVFGASNRKTTEIKKEITTILQIADNTAKGI